MTIQHTDEFFMAKALREAEKAAKIAEVPVGAVICKNGKVIARAHNLRETKQRPTAHAELLVIEKAARKLGAWRLEKTQLYVTLEPCLMCWGSVILARIPEVIFGAQDPKAGVCGSVLSLHEQKLFNHFPQVRSGVLEAQCSQALSDFFKSLRTEKRKKL
ncbi:MAG: nucleoside deaminase [Deltaproteobacteria bacterium]|nr:nucleoside deaminase [Deltaproteobacteria bacterium]